jgi:UPF0716 protein FxsA
MGLIAPLLFLASEVWLLVEVGSATSALWVAAAVVLALALGLALMRRGARRAAELSDPGSVSTMMTPFGLLVTRRQSGDRRAEVLDAMGLVLAGLLLALPGFITDVFALVLLVPRARRALLARALALRTPPGASYTAPGRPSRRPTADVEVLPPGSLPQSPLRKRPVVIDVD